MLTTTVYCRRCRASFESPMLSDSDRAHIVELVRAQKIIDAIKLLREVSGIELRDAKAVQMHITRTAGVCHRCPEHLHGLGQTECSRCGSLNLDW